MKKIVFGLYFILLSIVVGCGKKTSETVVKTTENKSVVSSDENQSICFANSLREEIDNDVKISIMIGKDNKEIDKVSVDNLSDVMYGFEVHQRNEKGWVTQQICKEKEAITYGFLDTASSYYDPDTNKSFSNKIISTGASGLKNNNLTLGTYTLYVYTSPDKKNWIIAGKKDFNIVK